MKKIFILLILNTFLFSKYLQYTPSDDFAKYFNNFNCSLVMNKFYYYNCYDYNFKGTKATAYMVTRENLKAKQIKNRPRFEDDTTIAKKYRTTWSDYLDSGYDRGHSVANGSMRASVAAQRSTFLMSNITPQNRQINQKVWNSIEQRERDLAYKYYQAEILNLILYDKNPKRIKNNIAIPSAYIKIIKTKFHKECYKVPNHDVKSEDIRDYKISCDSF